MKHHCAVAATLILACAVCGIPAIAQSEPKPPVLAGPTVPTQAPRKTLVEHDFPGKVKRLDSTPEEAALRLMDLDVALRERVDRVLTERIKQLDDFVAKNLLLLTKLQTASATGDKLDQAVLLAQGVQKLSPVWRKGSLRAQLDEQLPADKQKELKALLDEYWDAIVREQHETAASAGDEIKLSPSVSSEKPQSKATKSTPASKVKKKARWEIMVAERLASFGKEIERSFQRQLQSGDILYRYIETAIVLTNEQKGKISQLCSDFAVKTKMNPTEKQNQELFVKIAGSLDMAQQAELVKLVNGLKKPKK